MPFLVGLLRARDCSPAVRSSTSRLTDRRRANRPPESARRSRNANALRYLPLASECQCFHQRVYALGDAMVGRLISALERGLQRPVGLFHKPVLVHRRARNFRLFRHRSASIPDSGFAAPAGVPAPATITPRSAALHNDFMASSRTGLRRHHNLDAPILLTVERRETLSRIGQLQTVGHDKAGVDRAVLDPVKQRTQIALRMRLSRPDG